METSNDKRLSKDSTEALLKDNSNSTVLDDVFMESENTVIHSNSSIHIEAKRNLSSCSVCRICYEDNCVETLISPCRCSGTMGVLHRSCVEKWLGSSNSNKCEICNFEYVTERRAKSLREWFKAPTDRTDRRNLIGDFSCFCFLTPLAGVSVWLCVQGAVTYSKHHSATWETVGLVTLSCFLIFIYFVWVTIAIRYHCRVIKDWRALNQQVHVIDMENKAKSGLLVPLNVLRSERDGHSQSQTFHSCHAFAESASPSTERHVSSPEFMCPNHIVRKTTSPIAIAHSLPNRSINDEHHLILCTHPDTSKNYLENHMQIIRGNVRAGTPPIEMPFSRSVESYLSQDSSKRDILSLDKTHILPKKS